MKTIFITNDDGIQAQGIQTLINLMSRLGRVIVVAPDSARSGAGCSITPTRPVELGKWDGSISPEVTGLLPAPGPHPIEYYTCSGTPVDCVKIASEHVLTQAPDLMVSGINHGDNASVSMHYSGTVGAVIEGTLKGWHAIAFSLQSFDKLARFEHCYDTIVRIAEHIMNHPLPNGQFLNVNFPVVDQLKGIRITRTARGAWTSEWANANRPYGNRAFWLTGQFGNLEPESTDTDYWALDHGYASASPIQLDMTAYQSMNLLKDLEGIKL